MISPTPQQTREAFSRLPRPVREFLSEGGLVEAVKSLSSSHSLHVDAMGNFANLVNLLLLGFVSPAELPEKLTQEVGISSDVVPGLITELNAQIFVPLQKRVRESKNEPAYVERIKEDEQSQPLSTGHSEPSYIPQNDTREPVVPVMQIGAVQRDAAPQTQPFPVAPLPPQITAQMPTYTPEPPVTQPQVSHAEPQLRTMQSDMVALQSHPTATPESIPFTPQASHATPALSFQTASLPNVNTAPAHQEASAPDPLSMAAPVRYAGDPYREAV